MILRQIRKNLNAAAGNSINMSWSGEAGKAYPDTDVYLGMKEGKRLGWRCWRREGRSDCGKNVEAQNCTADRRGKGTNLSVPSTWGGWALLKKISRQGGRWKEDLTLQLPELRDVTKGLEEHIDTTLVKVLQEFFDARVVLGTLH